MSSPVQLLPSAATLTGTELLYAAQTQNGALVDVQITSGQLTGLGTQNELREVGPSLTTLNETTRAVLDGTEAFRLATTGTNWKTTLQSLVGLSFLVTTSPRFNALTGNLELFVATTGSDSNDGSAAHPFATIQHALDIASIYNYEHIYSLAISVAAGTYNPVTIDLPTMVNQNAGALNGNFGPTVFGITGDKVTPSNVQLNYSMGMAIRGYNNAWDIEGFQLNLINANDGFWALGQCIIHIDAIIFNTSDTTFNSNCINASRVGRILIGTIPFFITVKSTGGGGLTFVFFAQDIATITDSGVTWTFSNSIPPFGGVTGGLAAVASIGDASKLFWGGGTVNNPSNLSGFLQYQNNSFSQLGYGPGSSINRSGFPGGIAGTADTTSVISQDPLYQIAAPTAGGTVNITAGCHKLIVNPSGTLSTVTIVLPAFMHDAEIVEVGTSQQLTAITWQAATTFSGGTPTIVGAPTSLTASGRTGFVFDAGLNTWYIN